MIKYNQFTFAESDKLKIRISVNGMINIIYHLL
jgi:hypothetical protein